MDDSTLMLHQIAAELGPDRNVAAAPDVAVGKWFGKPCLKVDGKVFAALWEGDMAFKLAGPARAEALQIEGARPFDPRGQGHSMIEWVQIPAQQSAAWSRFARLACGYVAGAAQAEKDAIIGGLAAARTSILEAAALLSPAQQDEVFLGEWSVKDLLAHLIGWDATNLQAVAEIRAGQRPGFFAHYDRDWKTYNARLVAQHRREDWAELVAAVEQSHRALIETLQAVPADDYVRYKKIQTLLRAEATDEEEHYRQVERLRTGGG